MILVVWFQVLSMKITLWIGQVCVSTPSLCSFTFNLLGLGSPSQASTEKCSHNSSTIMASGPGNSSTICRGHRGLDETRRSDNTVSVLDTLSYVFSRRVELWDAGVGVDGDVLRCQQSGLHCCALSISLIGVFDDVHLHRQLKNSITFNFIFLHQNKKRGYFEEQHWTSLTFTEWTQRHFSKIFLFVLVTVLVKKNVNIMLYW